MYRGVFLCVCKVVCVCVRVSIVVCACVQRCVCAYCLYLKSCSHGGSSKDYHHTRRCNYRLTETELVVSRLTLAAGAQIAAQVGE